MLDKTQKFELLTFAKGIARAGGDIALRSFGRGDPGVKFDHQLVTKTELTVNEMIQKEIYNTFQEHSIWGDKTSNTADFVWIVDPLDGVSMYSRSLPVWGIGIGLFYQKQLILGTFYMPITGELYEGIHGEKARLNDRPIHVLSDPVDNESLLLTYSRFHEDFTTSFPGKVRSLGSSLAHLCYLSRGSADGVVLKNVHLWDVAPSLAILSGAGGMIYDLNGKLFNPADYLEEGKIEESFIACNKSNFKEFKEFINNK